ncbi:hypothetical protein GCM10010121_087590 [Streptomyces brasiliensis]|uniref:Transposase n=1 Tax=Streptomyces brasiliensis TaxID=1954 RepID=A0A917P694_9ACTN|nr:hypothetical protein GCM10010121_087590 [Streptomyces brasiliensis]
MARAAAGLPAPRVTLVRSLTVENVDSIGFISGGTNMIESLNSRFRQASRRRGHFPSEEAALKVLYLAIRHQEPNRPNPTGRTHNWKAAINILAGFYGRSDAFSLGETE